MQIIITYDIPSKHREFKEKMFKMGYKESISGNNCETIYFPNTTLYHNNKTAVKARDEAHTLAKQLGISFDRCISTVWSGWAAFCGEPFT